MLITEQKQCFLNSNKWGTWEKSHWTNSSFLKQDGRDWALLSNWWKFFLIITHESFVFNVTVIWHDTCHPLYTASLEYIWVYFHHFSGTGWTGADSWLGQSAKESLNSYLCIWLKLHSRGRDRRRSSLDPWWTQSSQDWEPLRGVQMGWQRPKEGLEFPKSIVELDMESGPLLSLFHTCPITLYNLLLEI